MYLKKRYLLITIIVLVLLAPKFALAQTYLFDVSNETINVFWNEDGALSVDYVFIFSNDLLASPIDFLDVGMPNTNYDIGSIDADVNGQPITDIEESPYVKPGVALGLGSFSIPSGESGQVHIYIGRIESVLYPDSRDSNFVSAVFSPTWFDSEFVHGATDFTVTFHLPPGVKPEEPRWHSAPSGWPSEPETGFDNEGRIIYTWHNLNASASEKYLFGASFPAQYVPETAIIRPNSWSNLVSYIEAFIGPGLCCGIGALVIGLIVLAVNSTKKRKLQYLPPKIAIEGLGIKRGLTAVEAAILLEQPLDKNLTMILFGLIKKEATSVISRDPLKLSTGKRPENLRTYESEFLDAFSKPNLAEQQKALQEMMVTLVKSVAQKMKGFSRKETVEYYRDIMNRAWADVEAADTPEVKSQKFDDVMEWTMLDRDYDDRTRRVFREGPVFVPVWWPRFDPAFGRTAPVRPIPTTTPTGTGGLSLPHLPGSDFAAAMVRGVQNFSTSVIGNLNDFTSKITDKTNPVPVTTSTTRKSWTSGGGGCACACACACAGCACACAGGGR